LTIAHADLLLARHGPFNEQIGQRREAAPTPGRSFVSVIAGSAQFSMHSFLDKCMPLSRSVGQTKAGRKVPGSWLKCRRPAHPWNRYRANRCSMMQRQLSASIAGLFQFECRQLGTKETLKRASAGHMMVRRQS